MEHKNRFKLTTLATLIAASLVAGCNSDSSSTDTTDDTSISGQNGNSGMGDDMGNGNSNTAGDPNITSKLAYYGDYSGTRVFVIDVEKMKIEKIIEHTGAGPYETDQISATNAYVLNRDDTTINVVEFHENEITGTIPLNYKPRSIVPSPNGQFGLLTGKSEPWASVVDLNSHEIHSDGYKDSNYATISDFGGGNATGHPYWLNDNQFLLLDRTENAIELYATNSATPSAKLHTSSSVHHVFKIDNDYYGVLEGKRGATSAEAVSPGLVKFSVDEQTASLTLQQEKLIASYSGLPASFTPENWGAHHASLHPDGQHIYLGSYEGNLFVIDKDSLTLTDTVTAGLGLGHVAFIPEKNLAITTNHYAPYKTIIDVSNPAQNRIVKNLTVANTDTAGTGKRLQSHTSHTDPGKKFFYSVSSLDGKIYAIDLDRLEVARSATMSGAYPLMGALVIQQKEGEVEHEHLNHL